MHALGVLGVLLHWPPPHLSSVQPTLSSHSTALQHLPQVAVLPSALGQHSSPCPHSGTVVHLPAAHEPTMHGLLPVLHWESLQQAAQPTPSQHSVAFASGQKSCWHRLLSHES